MKKIRYSLLLIGLVICQSAIMSAQTKTSAEVKDIDAYCKTVDSLTSKNKTAFIFADTSDYEDANSRPKWQKFTSEKALEKFREKTETYSIAYNWLKGGKVVASNFTNFSPSGDWTMYVFHVYRADGSLARVKSELRTFQGDYIVIKTQYFNTSGKQISKTMKYLDLTTHKPKKASSNFNSSFAEEDYFTKTSKLPFASQLKK